jgi:quinol monooxygenase YgiN
MADCLGYYVCEDAKTEGVFWVAEVWTDPGAHDRAMASPEGRALMAANRPHFGHFELVAAFKPVAGAMRPTG